MHALCTPTYLSYLLTLSIYYFQIRVSDQYLFDLVTYEYHIYLPTYLPTYPRIEGARAQKVKIFHHHHLHIRQG